MKLSTEWQPLLISIVQLIGNSLWPCIVAWIVMKYHKPIIAGIKEVWPTIQAFKLGSGGIELIVRETIQKQQLENEIDNAEDLSLSTTSSLPVVQQNMGPHPGQYAVQQINELENFLRQQFGKYASTVGRPPSIVRLLEIALEQGVANAELVKGGGVLYRARRNLSEIGDAATEQQAQKVVTLAHSIQSEIQAHLNSHSQR